MKELDQQLFMLLNFDGGESLDTFFLYATKHSAFYIVGAVAIISIFYKYGAKKLLFSILSIVAGIGLSDQICNVVKNCYHKYRPIYDMDIQMSLNFVEQYVQSSLYGPVSAHAATSVVMAIISASIIKNRAYNIFVTIATILICYSRIYLAAHFPMDILLGAIIGCIVAAIILKINKFLKFK